MRVLIAGDTHGNLPWTLHLLDKAQEFECETIFVLGDFGYWPRMGDGRDFLYKLEHQLRKAGIHLSWLDGNHEDHDELDKLVAKHADYRKIMGVVPVSDHIVYTPRGYSWRWDQVSFVSLGGAVSVDRHLRKEGWDWFPQEVISQEDVEIAKRVGRADVLLSHDSPACSPIEGHIYRTQGTTEEDSWENRKKVEEVAEALGVRRIYHGHHHYTDKTDYKIGGKWVTVESLDRDHQTGSWTILDTSAPVV